MKNLILTVLVLSLSTAAQAEVLSSCQSSCYANKASCNSRKSHTFNSCDESLFACKASCSSGKLQKTYGENPLEISFQPILDLE